MVQKNLAAIIYPAADGAQADSLLVGVAKHLQDFRLRLAGTVQLNTKGDNQRRCDMSMQDLSSGRIIEISENVDPTARGCRLDYQALEDMAGLTETAVDRGSDLLIINKFGKREAAGHGFRQTIDTAVAHDIPVLTCVGPESLSNWRDYTGDLALDLPIDFDRAIAWCMQTVPAARTCVISCR